MKTSQVPNRSLGKRSPLDKLTEPVKTELFRRCQGQETYAQIIQWLSRRHAVRISDAALSDWWRRRSAREQSAAKQTETCIVFAHGLEIAIVAPGAESITVRVKPETAAPAAAR